MPDENIQLPISSHDQDVIFNKPSLKEFVRLIKNGTINAIWPSTKLEFDWWNDSGLKEYAILSGRSEEDLRLKSIKTALTVYYGDNEDQTGEKLVINIDATDIKFIELINEVDKFKSDLILKNFFDENVVLGYPDLSWNQSTGDINEKDTFIDNHQNVKTIYNENLTILNNLKNIVENFEPTDVTEVVSLSVTDLEEQYKKYFNDDETLLDSSIKSMPNIEIDVEQLKTKSITTIDANGNKIFSFENLINIVNQYENIIASDSFKNINNYYQINLKSFEDNLSTIKEAAQGMIEKRVSISDNLNNYITLANQQQSLLYTSLLDITRDMLEIKTPTNSSDRTLAYLQSEIQNRKELYKHLLILTSKGLVNKQETEAESVINQIIQDITDLTKFTDRLNYVDTNFIEPMYTMISNLKNIDLNTVINQVYIKHGTGAYIISYGYDPIGVYGHQSIRAEFDQLCNIIISEHYINNWFNTNIYPDSVEYISQFTQAMDILRQTLYTSILGEDNPDELSPLAKAQEKSLTAFNALINDYLQIVQDFKQTGFVSLEPEETIIIDGINGVITNKDTLLESVQNEYSKVSNVISVIQSIWNTIDISLVINILNTNYGNIKEKLEEVKVLSNSYSTEEAFNIWKTENINEELLRKAVYYINNSTDIENLIPIPTDNYMSISNLSAIQEEYINLENTYNEREIALTNLFDNINTVLNNWLPAFSTTAIEHYICINVGSFIQFPTESNSSPYFDGSISISVDETMHYPMINGLADNLKATSLRNSQIPTIAGLKSVFGEKFNQIGTTTAGSSYQPLYLSEGKFTIANNSVSGEYGTLKDSKSAGWKITNTAGTEVSVQAVKVFGAVYNDYAEYRSADAQAGRCIIENGDGTLSLSTGRLQLGANIVSDTYGFAIGETNDATCPIAVCGRVLAHPLESKEMYHPGAAVCSGPEGTVSLMSREEIREWPDAIVGYVSEVPTYDTWGTDNVPVNGRIWIKIK